MSPEGALMIPRSSLATALDRHKRWDWGECEVFKDDDAALEIERDLILSIVRSTLSGTRFCIATEANRRSCSVNLPAEFIIPTKQKL